LEAIKAERGARVEDGSIEPSKPLVEVLREAKEAKEAAFQAVWKSMKVGEYSHHVCIDTEQYPTLLTVKYGALTEPHAQQEDQYPTLLTVKYGALTESHPQQE